VFQNPRMSTADNRLFANQVFDWLAEIEWLKIMPSLGTVPPGDSVAVEAVFNTTGLSVGSYNADIVLSSNDPDSSTIVVPVLLNVVDYICGDVNGDSIGPNVVDVTYLVDFLFLSGPEPPVMDAANVNGEGGVNVADVTYLVDFLFLQGPDLVCGPVK
ncbi:MAG: hypothetical protein ACE5K8_06740, partial [Candidatus Zixiibacteriota bacterium]